MKTGVIYCEADKISISEVYCNTSNSKARENNINLNFKGSGN
jgi:hypothetical protein